jgi:hypothetical protein
MVLAMYCHPLFCNHACCEPQPESHEVLYDRVKFYAFVCLASM